MYDIEGDAGVVDQGGKSDYTDENIANGYVYNVAQIQCIQMRSFGAKHENAKQSLRPIVSVL